MYLRLVAKSAIIGIIFLFVYLLVVILTTPNFPPLISVAIAVNLNGIYIFSSAISVAFQTWILGCSKTLPEYCRIPKGRAAFSLNALSSIASSFFSFFALVGVGCCGMWLFILSLLPGVFGVGLSTILIQYSTLLAQLGLSLMVISNIYALLSLRRKIKMHKLGRKN